MHNVMLAAELDQGSPVRIVQVDSEQVWRRISHDIARANIPSGATGIVTAETGDRFGYSWLPTDFLTIPASVLQIYTKLPPSIYLLA